MRRIHYPGLSKPVSWSSCLVWGKLGSIRKSLFDAVVTGPGSHIMRMDGSPDPRKT